MPVLSILTYPAAILRARAEPVETVDDALRTLASSMIATMHAAPGVGLAAPQIGIGRRLLVMDPSRGEEPEAPIVMINPHILRIGEGTRLHEEGCLSIPEHFAEIERPASVEVAFVDHCGKPQQMLCEGLLATIVQHEIDHLDGVLFVDHLSRLKRVRLLKKFLKGQRDDALV